MNIEKLALAIKYNCAYWFFSDLANIDMQVAIKAISANLKTGGKILLDTDNIFRLVSRLQKKVDKNLFFDTENLLLIEKNSGVKVMYPVVPMWRQWLQEAGLEIDRIFGGYHFEKYSLESQRLILIPTVKHLTQRGDTVTPYETREISTPLRP
jgi:hypothetical protein